MSFDPTLRRNERHDAAVSKLRVRACSEHGTEFVAACEEWSTKNNEPRASMTGLDLKSERKTRRRRTETRAIDEQQNEAPVNNGSGGLVGDVVVGIIVHSKGWNVG